MSSNSRNQLMYPEYQLHIGSYLFHEGVALDWYSSKQRLMDYVHIRFTKKLHQTFPWKRMEKVTFQWGYEGNQKKIFSGFIDRVGQSGNEIIAKDFFLKLQEETIKEIFVDVTQNDYLTGVLRQAGVNSFELKKTDPVIRKKINLPKITFAEAIQQANPLWRTKELFYFDEQNKFYFGTPKEQIEQYLFEYGENILNLSKQEGTYEMEILADHIHYTNQIKVSHPDCQGIFEIEEVRFHITERGFPKMYLYFKEESE